MSDKTTHLTAGEVMDRVASLMNDTAKTSYTYAAQIPYLKTAMDDLQMEFELNNIPVTNQEAATLPINVGIVQVLPPTDTTPGVPHYPDDLIEIQGIYERLQGSTDPFLQMSKKEFLPHYLDGENLDALLYWVWEDQIIKFNPLGATTPREIKIDYVRGLFYPPIVDENSLINVINTVSYLSYRTAALCSRYIGENETRAEQLDLDAVNAMDRVLGIGTKGRQSITTRRRPFRASYRSRGIW